MKRKEWLKQKEEKISGTFASAILGQNPYMTNVQAWEYITGKKKQEDISEKEFVKYGLQAEKHLIELFRLDYPQYDVKTKKYDLRVHPQFSFLIGSIDGELIEKNSQIRGILEIKTTNILNSMHQERWEGAMVPQNYYIQILHYMNVTGYEFAILKAQMKTIYGDEVRLKTKHYFYSRDQLEIQESLNFLLEKEIEFYEKYIKTDIRPNLILPEI